MKERAAFTPKFDVAYGQNSKSTKTFGFLKPCAYVSAFFLHTYYYKGCDAMHVLLETRAGTLTD